MIGNSKFCLGTGATSTAKRDAFSKKLSMGPFSFMPTWVLTKIEKIVVILLVGRTSPTELITPS